MKRAVVAKPPSRRQVALAMPARGALRIVAVADTHGRPHPRAQELVAALRPDAILHAGDIGELNVLEDLAQIAPVHAVRGNIDVHAPELPDLLTVDIERPGGRLRVLVMHIAVVGPRLRADAAKIAREVGAAIVVCGHSHVPFIGVDRGIAVFNPGSIGPRRFSLPIVYGVMEVPAAGGMRLRHESCETGQLWMP